MSMNSEKLLVEAQKEEMKIRGEGADAWSALQRPGLAVAERRELRRTVTEKQEELEELQEEVKLLTMQYQIEHASMAAKAAEQFPPPPVDDAKTMALFLSGGLNRLMWSIVSTTDFIEREVNRLEDEKGRGTDQDLPTSGNAIPGTSPYEQREERIEKNQAQLQNMRIVYEWALVEAKAALDALDPNDQYQPVIETEHMVRAKKAAGPAGSPRKGNPFAL